MSPSNIQDEKAKKFYTLFCEVFTAFHNYATAKRLSQNQLYSWSLTSYYYSLMHCGRVICFMSLNCFPKRHEDLHKLLKGININNAKFWKLNTPNGEKETHKFSELINALHEIDNNLEKEKIKQLGEYLEKIKRIREFNSYEMFIVAHQIQHGILSPKLKDGTKKIDQIVRDYLTLITRLLFYCAQQRNEYFKAFLLDKNPKHKWAFEYLKRSLEKQNFDKGIIDEIYKIIKENLLDRLSAEVDIDCPDEFYNKISFGLFNEKSGIINSFIELLEEIENETDRHS